MGEEWPYLRGIHMYIDISTYIYMDYLQRTDLGPTLGSDEKSLEGKAKQPFA